jgi:hypothetical protein
LSVTLPKTTSGSNGIMPLFLKALRMFFSVIALVNAA